MRPRILNVNAGRYVHVVEPEWMACWLVSSEGAAADALAARIAEETRILERHQLRVDRMSAAYVAMVTP